MENAEGLTFDRNGIITGLDLTFLENLDDLVRRAKNANVQLYLCLTSWTGIKKFPSPVRDMRQQQAYLDKAVKAIARRLKGNKSIWAFDLYNEIEAEIQDNAVQKVTIPQARLFIQKSAKAVKNIDRTRMVSAGSGYHGWEPVQKGYSRNLGLDFYDIHIYRDDGYLPHIRELNVDKPVIVGEFGQATKRDDDQLQRKAVQTFMENVIRKGYSGCFVWAYGPERYHELVRSNGEHRPVVADITRIIRQHK